MDLEAVKDAIRRGNTLVTLHAQREAAADSLLVGEVWNSLLDPSAEIIEDNPNDPRGPTGLILTWIAGRPIHCLVAYPAPRASRAQGAPSMAVLVTLWRPDERLNEWSSDFKTRLP